MKIIKSFSSLTANHLMSRLLVVQYKRHIYRLLQYRKLHIFVKWFDWKWSRRVFIFKVCTCCDFVILIITWYPHKISVTLFYSFDIYFLFYYDFPNSKLIDFYWYHSREVIELWFILGSNQSMNSTIPCATQLVILVASLLLALYFE